MQSEYLNSGNLGGISRYCQELTRSIPLLLKPSGARVSVTSIPETQFGMLSTKIKGLTFRPSSRIIHNLTERPLIPLRRGGSILVNTAHEFQRILYPEITKAEGRLPSEMPSYWIKKSYQLDILKGDCLVANSSQTRDEAVRLGFKGDIFVVNPGVSAEFSKEKKVKPRGKDFVIGYIGTIRKRKGIGMLVESMAHLDPSFKLKIYGTVFRRYEKEFSGILREAKNTEYCGVAPDVGIVDVYDHLDAFVMPSVYEGFGLGILEAQARGLPVIVNGKGLLPLETSRYCYKADGASQIANTLLEIKRNGYDERTRKAAEAYSRGFTWERTAKEMIKVYEKLS
jgi:glycosyltransferase involved in cell wall biosynthesis